nr:Os09g0482761 [Ipomoea batatas]
MEEMKLEMQTSRHWRLCPQPGHLQRGRYLVLVQVHSPGDVCEVQTVKLPTSKGIYRAELAEVSEVREGVVMWQRVEKAERLELASSEVGERDLLQLRERLVFGHKERDPFLCIVGLVLESFYDFGRFEVVKEGVEWASNREKIGTTSYCNGETCQRVQKHLYFQNIKDEKNQSSELLTLMGLTQVLYSTAFIRPRNSERRVLMVSSHLRPALALASLSS